MTPAALRSYAADFGIGVDYIEGLTGWLDDAPPILPQFTAVFTEDDIAATAEALEATRYVAVDLSAGEPLPLDQSAEAFARICDRAAERGLEVCLEFVPWTRIPTLAHAWDIVRTAARDNGSILLDNLHWRRGGGTLDDLAGVPAEQIRAVQLSDSPNAVPDDLVTEAIAGRLLPGYGDGDVVGLLAALDACGCRAPLGVEVFSTELMALPSREAAERCGRAIHAVVAAARTDSGATYKAAGSRRPG
jgi:sugar phosphate isomerase/epimerase